MRGYRDGKPVVNCDVCHKPIEIRKKRIEEPTYKRQHQRTDGWLMDVHTGACKKKADDVKISKRAEPEDAEA